MKKILLLFGGLALMCSSSNAQTTVTAQIGQGSDDAEEYIYAPLNEVIRTQGSMDVTSSDIELGYENKGGVNPQISGLRFTNLDIPKGALIVSAKIKFTVDASTKNEDPANYFVYIEDNVNSATFAADNGNITKRNWLKDSIAWNVMPGTWAAVNEKNSTANLAPLVQQLVDKLAWENGKALTFFIKGTGVREAESFEGEAPDAAVLEITYITVNEIVTKLTSDTDDSEEVLPGGATGSKVTGRIDLSSSDLEFGTEDKNNVTPQMVGLRFSNLDIPKGAKIISAKIQLNVDEVEKNENPFNQFIYIENTPSPAVFNANPFNLSSRTFLKDSVLWTNPSGTWTKVGESGSDQTTSELKNLAQQLVDNPNWETGKTMAFYFKGTGSRTSESSSDANGAPKLIIRFIPVAQNKYTLSADGDDSEENLPGGTEPAGKIDLGSSDLELGFEVSSTQDRQLVGMRFTNIDLPKGTIIESAHIQFTADETVNDSPFEQYIYVQNSISPAVFTTKAFDISSREVIKDSILWSTANWNTLSESGEAQKTSNIARLINTLLSRQDWVQGSSIAVFMKGTGRRIAESSADALGAPKLIINFLQGEIIYKPELVKEIPDQKLVEGWEISLDVKPFFIDKDSEMTFWVKDLAGKAIPTNFEMKNGVITGSSNLPTVESFKVFAASKGDTISDVFQAIFEAKTKPILTQLGTIELGTTGSGAAEISAFDPISKRLFVANAELKAINILDFSNPSNIILLDTILLPSFAGGVNSVAVNNGLLVAAIEDNVKQKNGFVYAYNTNGKELWNVEVGALPDMLTFSENGKIIVANEGEPNASYTVDPIGSISIIDTTSKNVVSIDFSSLNGQEQTLATKGIRIFGPGASVAMDMEPEYITVKGDSAFVTCQENNAIAVIKISTGTLMDLYGLGTKDHNILGNGIDLPKANGVYIKEAPVKGFYMPDAISSFVSGGKTYLITANEGDSRVYTNYSEETSVGSLKLDPTIFKDPSFANLASNLKITKAPADTNALGQYKTLYTFGSRSFSIWDAKTGTQVYDSGDDLEQITASMFPSIFNVSNNNLEFKNRSDDKGPEPEAVVIGEVDGKQLAFVGLERTGGVMVYDVTNPNSPVFLDYLNNRNAVTNTGDTGPEGLLFIPAAQSPNGVALIVVSNEISGTVTAYSAGEAKPKFTLNIFHNNDGESDLLPEKIVLNGDTLNAGSISQFKHLLDSMRTQAITRGYPSIMLSSGDNFLAGLEYNASQANNIYYDAVAMDSLKYDAIDLGNHDFDFGTQVLSEFINAYKVNKAPYLSSNLSFKNVPEMQALVDAGRVRSSVIVEKMGEKIGIIGLTTPLLPSISSPGNTIVSEAIVDSVQKQLDYLNTQGVNKIILISHLQNLNTEIALAAKLTGIDVIIAGGGDELLSNDSKKGKPFKIDNPVGTYPYVAKDKAGKSVYLITTPGNYRYLGNLLLDFDADGNITKVYESSDLILNAGPSDSTLKAQIEDPINKYIGDLATNVVAHLEDSLDFRRSSIRTKETNAGNLFADAMLWQAQKTHATYGVKKPQIALQNSGGLRIEQLLSPGNMTEDKTYSTAAFTNILSVVEDIPAAHLLKLMEHGLYLFSLENGGFPQISGFKIVYDPAAPANNRIISMTLNDGTKLVENGEVVSGAPRVSMATIDFTAKGGDAYPFDTLGHKTLGATYQQAFLNFLTQGLKDSTVTKKDYPFGMNQRIVEQASLSPALDSVVVDFASTCPTIPLNFVEYHTGADMLKCNTSYLQFNGFGIGTGESWLITPRINFDEKDYKMKFRAENDFDNIAGPDVEVYYSTDYNGIGNPKNSTWTLIPSASNFFNVAPKPTSPTNSPEFDLASIDKEAHIAFVYYSSTTTSGGNSRANLFNLSIKPIVPLVNAGLKTIAQIQGAGAKSSLENSLVTTTGIVTQIFLNKTPYTGAKYTSNIPGFYVQDRMGDANNATSEALWVSVNSNLVSVGDSISITGLVSESFGVTQLSSISSLTVLSKGNSAIAPKTISSAIDFETVENMMVEINADMTVTENRNLEEFGELKISFGGILYQPTQLIDPKDKIAVANLQLANKNKSIILDDARNGNGNNPIAYLGTDGALRAGTKVSGLKGIMSNTFGNYRLIPTKAPMFRYAPADELPNLGQSSLKVVSFNVLNYFNGDGKGAGFPTSRGAANASAFALQSKKIVTAMKAMDADIYALMEIENDDDNGFSAIQSLVDSLNKAYNSKVYTFVKTGKVLRSNATFDEIKNGFIYKTSRVDTLGKFAILNNSFDVNYFDANNRPSIAQTFVQKSNRQTFTAITCHLKSKGSDCNANNDPDANDGQGNCNLTRKGAASVIASWLATDPTKSGDEDFLILGDLNSYAKEDPIHTLKLAGYQSVKSDSNYTYVFDGQFGSLDHALVNSSLKTQVSGADVWHINSIENDFKAYNSVDSLNTNDERASSDHDPILVGLNLQITGTNKLLDANTLTAYPNPTSDFVQFTAPVTGELLNNHGVPLQTLDKVSKLDFSTYPEGIYLVKLENGGVLKISFLK